MTTAIIADDEIALLNYLNELLQKAWPNLDIIATVPDGVSALNVIQQKQPDIAFLDIAMPGLTGLEVAQQSPNTHIVFVTAYDHYAVEAFEKQAIDYLLKPVELKRLEQTIKKLKDKLSQTPVNLNQVIQQLQQSNKAQDTLKWLRVQHKDEVVLVNVNEVDYFQSADKYTSVFTRDKEYLLRTSLKDIEKQIDGDQFWRIHRSTIINVNSIAKITKSLSGQLLVNIKGKKRSLSVSRAHLHLFK